MKVRARILTVVQTMLVPCGRCGWLQRRVLAPAGYRAAVARHNGTTARSDPSYQVIGSVLVHERRYCAPGGGKVSFAAEYAHSFLAMAWLTLLATRSGRLAVIRRGNTPDVIAPIAAAFRAIEGTTAVFGLYEPGPELYESRFPGGRRLLRVGALDRSQASRHHWTRTP